MAVITVKNLSKYYSINNSRESRILTLRDKLFNVINNHKINKINKKIVNYPALVNIDFSVEGGEVLGIIGRNGAGKSTILKILSRITEPTTGNIRIKGRVSSILEVGTGIHQELTGRENIYLNGAILGMTKKEIDRKFNEIVDFSGVENFLDIPIKRYSSGMQTRLAFSVAAHMTSDILLIDEVLAVGDFEFQKKCMDRMSALTKNSGRTILFVSHDMGAIRNLCDRCLYLKEGKVEKIGGVKEVVDYYLQDGNESQEISLSSRVDRTGSGRIKLIDFFGGDSSGNKTFNFLSGQSMVLKFFYESKNINKNDNIDIFIGFNAVSGARVMTLSNKYTGDIIRDDSNNGVIKLIIPILTLAKGVYSLDVTVKYNNDTVDNIHDIGKIFVESGGFYKHESSDIAKLDRGSMLIDHRWEKET